ncbi:hypothetical protein PROFUN_07451 [Planoprotostelium fungivorum]|uniref:Uncharacterized protein n=1 Tax=Planoprotostelium fungivorum TaxID=1890364 RepID=A0A2P6NLH6_9EUKA|nr:hypothetical protein PROFUN_07451 [Planoprotostelium fungivorum]
MLHTDRRVPEDHNKTDLVQFGGEVPNQESKSLDIQYSRMTLRYMILVTFRNYPG